MATFKTHTGSAAFKQEKTGNILVNVQWLCSSLDSVQSGGSTSKADACDLLTRRARTIRLWRHQTVLPTVLSSSPSTARRTGISAL
jgi:hypothetical protein